MQQSGTKMTQEELRKFEQGWADMLVDILHERIQMLRIRDTGALYGSVRKRRVTDRTIEHQFLQYGIYVANGTGNGYRRDNGGDLEILDKDYRKKHGLKKKRQARDWFFNRYHYSIHRLNEKEAAFYGEQYRGMVKEYLETMAHV